MRATRGTGELTMLPSSGRPIRGPARNKRYTEVEFEAAGRFPFPSTRRRGVGPCYVGWSLGVTRLGGDDPDAIRFTLVFQLESDEWRIVFGHVSIAEREDIPTAPTDGLDQATSELLGTRP